MEIKIICDCGQKFKFDAEPVDGVMSWEVNCPVCGASGTAKANEVIRQQLSAAVPPPPSAEPATPSPAEAPAAPAKPRLTISRPPHAAPSAPPVAPTMPRPIGAGAKPAVRMTRKAQTETHEPKFWLSVCAVLLGAFLGMMLWHFGYRLTGWRLGFMALITGCAAGAGPQVFGHYRGVGMGLIAAFVTFVTIFATQFLNAKVEIKEVKKEWAEEESQSALDEAKATLEAVPNGTDQEIRAYLAKEQSFESFTVSPSEIDAEEVRSVRAMLPVMRDLSDGKITVEEYLKREQLEYSKAEFETAVADARTVVAAVPNGTEQEFRVYLARESTREGIRLTPAEVDPETVAYLQAEYPQMKRLAEGQLTQEQYAILNGDGELPIDDDDILNFYVIFQTIGIFNIINIVLGIGAAFLTAKG